MLFPVEKGKRRDQNLAFGDSMYKSGFGNGYSNDFVADYVSTNGQLSENGYGSGTIPNAYLNGIYENGTTKHEQLGKFYLMIIISSNFFLEILK